MTNLSSADAAGVQHLGFLDAGSEEHEASGGAVRVDDAIGLTGGMPCQDRLHRLHGGYGLAICGEVVVCQLPSPLKACVSFLGWATELNGRDFADEPL